MLGIINTIATVAVGTVLQASAMNTVSTTPDESAQELLDALKAGDSTVMAQYADNEYINFLTNADEEQKNNEEIRKAIFKDFSYEIVDSATKNNVAVVKIKINRDDFSGVDEAYDKESYKYVTGNLYSEDVTNKDKLEEKCLQIYIDEIKKAAKKKGEETTIYLPLKSNGYHGWNPLLSDEIMKEICGNLELPNSK